MNHAIHPRTIGQDERPSGLQQFGPIVNVDKSSPPYGNARRFTTDVDVNNNDKRGHSLVTPGNSAVQDASGKFVHEDVWRCLFTHPVDLVGQSTTNQ